jgi:hypothetical protein
VQQLPYPVAALAGIDDFDRRPLSENRHNHPLLTPIVAQGTTLVQPDI